MICSMSIETVTPSAMLPAKAQASAAYARRLVQPEMNLRKNDGDGLFGDCAVHTVLPLRRTVTLHRPGQSSRTGAILWLLSGQLDHEILGPKRATNGRDGPP
jgi:hypothetical protein